jgi:hypothetical protein
MFPDNWCSAIEPAEVDRGAITTKRGIMASVVMACCRVLKEEHHTVFVQWHNVLSAVGQSDVPNEVNSIFLSHNWH